MFGFWTVAAGLLLNDSYNSDHCTKSNKHTQHEKIDTEGKKPQHTQRKPQNPIFRLNVMFSMRFSFKLYSSYGNTKGMLCANTYTCIFQFQFLQFALRFHFAALFYHLKLEKNLKSKHTQIQLTIRRFLYQCQIIK